MRYWYIIDFRDSISIFADFSHSIVVLEPPAPPPVSPSLIINCVWGTRTQLLICVGCPVQLVREVFPRLHLCRHTFAWLWGDCLRFASLWQANSCDDSCVLCVHLPNVCWGLLFVSVKRSYFKSLLKVYYQSVFVESSKVFSTLGRILF